MAVAIVAAASFPILATPAPFSPEVLASDFAFSTIRDCRCDWVKASFESFWFISSRLVSSLANFLVMSVSDPALFRALSYSPASTFSRFTACFLTLLASLSTSLILFVFLTIESIALSKSAVSPTKTNLISFAILRMPPFVILASHIPCITVIV